MSKQKDKMSIFGIGPKLAVITIFYAIIMFLVNGYSYIDFTINVIPKAVLMSLGIILIIIGFSLLGISFITVKKAYKEDYLCVKGIYSICRHPLYSAWIVFIVPGIVLILRSWILLTVPLVMYFVFRIL